jgi:hypothetical protein
VARVALDRRGRIERGLRLNNRRSGLKGRLTIRTELLPGPNGDGSRLNSSANRKIRYNQESGEGCAGGSDVSGRRWGWDDCGGSRACGVACRWIGIGRSGLGLARRLLKWDRHWIATVLTAQVAVGAALGIAA